MLASAGKTSVMNARPHPALSPEARVDATASLGIICVAVAVAGNCRSGSRRLSNREGKGTRQEFPITCPAFGLGGWAAPGIGTGGRDAARTVRLEA
jgi:hypothetical protein